MFRPVRRIDGYLPLEDYGLVGDGSTAALVGRDGSVDWLCVPRFDSEPLFCGVLDARRGGAFGIALEGLVEAEQRYDGESAVLVTELRSADGTVRVTDLLTIRSGADLVEDVPADRGELLRVVEGLSGEAQVDVLLEPREGGDVHAHADGLAIEPAGRPDVDVRLWASFDLGELPCRRTVREGDRFHLLLRWSGGTKRFRISPERLLDQTRAAWSQWMSHVEYDGPAKELVRRSGITLKLLDHFSNGAIVAAPTSSLPEWIGGKRNWDYRYTWIRDAAFSVYALRRIGLEEEAWSFLAWVLEAVERHPDDRPRVLYDLDGNEIFEEREDERLEGYRSSAPVRWGNEAGHQRQHDVFGEILDCAYQWAQWGRSIDEPLWRRLRRLVDCAAQEWREPDHGIWEIRSAGRPFTYSAALCHVALDRGARMAEHLGLDADVPGWRRSAERIRRAILEDAWDDELGALTEHVGEGGGLDGSLLALPLRRVVAADHPRMAATVEAIRERLGAGDGLLYRYLPDESPDGVSGEEGAFLLCSFWLVDNLAKQGRVDEAGSLFEDLCARASPLGLLPEQIEPESGSFLGNFPQAFSHVGVISSAVNLARAQARDGEASRRARKRVRMQTAAIGAA